MKSGGGSESTIIIVPSKSVLVYALHSLEYVLGLCLWSLLHIIRPAIFFFFFNDKKYYFIEIILSYLHWRFLFFWVVSFSGVGTSWTSIRFHLGVFRCSGHVTDIRTFLLLSFSGQLHLKRLTAYVKKVPTPASVTKPGQESAKDCTN